jgi:hypothetical protein
VRNALTAEGYLAVACWGWCEAREVIEEYLAPHAVQIQP